MARELTAPTLYSICLDTALCVVDFHLITYAESYLSIVSAGAPLLVSASALTSRRSIQVGIATRLLLVLAQWLNMPVTIDM